MRGIRLSALGALAAAAMVVCGLALSGCDEKTASDAAPATDKPAIGVLLYRKDDAYISLVASALKEALADQATVIMFDAENDQLTQNEQLEYILDVPVSAVAINLVDPKNASRVVDRMKKAGLPVIFFNREPDLDLLRQYGKARFVGTIASDAGKMQGDIIKNLWDKHPEYDRNQDGVFQYIMIQGNADNPEALARSEYSVRQAKEHGVRMRQVGATYICDWDEERAREAMRMAFAARGQEIELVIANNDAMALGAVAALREVGFNTGRRAGRVIPVLGVDATPEAVKAIRNGMMSATVKQDGEGMGKAIALLTLNAVRGKSFLDGSPYDWDASGVAIRIPYSPFTE